MECKSPLGYLALFLLLRINRNIVECKWQNGLQTLPEGLVLIETLWNVNYITCWVCQVWCFRINRNIVECKLHPGTLSKMLSYGINRNIVECKYDIIGGKSKVRSRINRNIVECKFLQSCHSSQSGHTVLIETLWNVNISTGSR